MAGQPLSPSSAGAEIVFRFPKQRSEFVVVNAEGHELFVDVPEVVEA